MPAASLDFYTPDLMDHIESPLAHYESDQSYSSHESSFQSHRSFQQSLQSPTVPQINIADDLIQQGEIAYEYMAYPDKKGNVNYLWSSKTKSSMSPEHFSVSHKDVIIPEDFNASIYYDQKVGSPASYSNTGNDNVSIPKASHQNEYQSGGVDLSKDFPKAFPNLQHYTDIVNTSDMASQGNNQLSPQTVSPSYSKPNIVQSHEFYDEESNDTSTSEFVSWTCKHPENWSATEVLDWLYYSAEKNGVDCSLLRGESFRTVTGEVLCSMGPDDFLSLEPHYGQFFYKLFRQLVDGLRFTLATETHFVDQPEVEPPMIYTDSQTQHYGNDVASIKLSQGYPHSNDLSQGQSSAHPSLEGYQQYQQNKESYNFEFAPSSLSQNQSTVESLLMQGYDYNTSTHDLKYEHMYGYEYPTEGYPMPQRENYRRTQSDVTSTRAKYADGVTPARRRPGRPRIKSDPTEEELRAQREKKLKSQHLWEFIFDILNNPAYNPSILKWENQNEGVFRFIQSESVAQLWGTLKNNENMTYEKLSRAMRHYYKRGILERVEGRRLVYKFSMVTLDKMREKRLLAGRQLGQ